VVEESYLPVDFLDGSAMLGGGLEEITGYASVEVGILLYIELKSCTDFPLLGDT
jgi:hypothetical protein